MTAIKFNTPYRFISKYDSSLALEIDNSFDAAMFGIDSLCKASDTANTALQAFTVVPMDGMMLIRSYTNPRLHLAHDEPQGTRAHYFTPGNNDYFMHAIGFYSSDEFPMSHSWTLEEQSNGTYVIVSGSEAVAVDSLPGNFQYYCVMTAKNTSDSKQQWLLEEVDADGLSDRFYFPSSSNGARYRLANFANPNSVLSLDFGSHSVKLATSSSEPSQRFIKVPNADGSVTFRSAESPQNIVLTAISGNTRSPIVGKLEDGGIGQRWWLEEADGGLYHIESHIIPGANKRLDYTGSPQDGTRCVVWPVEASGQQWAIEQLSGTNFWKIRYPGTNLYVQIDSASTYDSAISVLRAVDGNASQLFSTSADSLGRFQFQSCANDTFFLGATGLGKEYMVLGQEDGTASIVKWYVEPTVGSAFRVEPFERINECYCLDTMEAEGDSGENCIVRANQISHTIQALSAQWLFEEIPPQAEEGNPYIVHIAQGSGSGAKALQIGTSLLSSGQRALSVAAYDENSTVQQFEMRVNADGTRTFVSCAYDTFAIMLNGASAASAINCAALTGEPTALQRWRCFRSVEGDYEVRSMADANLLLSRASETGTNCKATSFEAGNGLQRWWLDAGGWEDGGSGGGDEPGGDDPVDESGWVAGRLVYRMRNVDNDTVAVTLGTASPADGTAATVGAVSDSKSQLFAIQPSGNGTCALLSVANDDLALTAVETITWRSAVQAKTYTSNANQLWTLDVQSDGTFHVACAANSTWMLDVNGSTVQTGASCIMWQDNGGDTQKWELVPVVLDADGEIIPAGLTTVRLRNFSNTALYTQLVSNTPTDGVVANVRPLDGSSKQVFTWTASGSSVRFLSAAAGGIALSADTVAQNEAVCGKTASVSSSKQFWVPEIQSDGTYRFQNLSDQTLVLDTTNTPATSSSQCILWGKNTLATQKWLIEPVAASESGGEDGGGGGDTPTAPTSLWYIRNRCTPSVVLRFNDNPAVAGSATSTSYPSLALNQLFVKQDNGDGTVSFLSYPNQDMALTASSFDYWGPVVAAAIGQGPSSNQKWTIPVQADGSRHIVSTGNSSWMLDTRGSVPGHGSEGIVWTDNGGSTQKWDIEEVTVLQADSSGNAVLPKVRIRSVCTPTVAVEVALSGGSATGSVATQTVGTGTAQQFAMRSNGDGTVTFISVADPSVALTAKTLGYRGAVTAETLDGAAVGQYQKWRIAVQSDGSYHIVSGANTSWMLDTNGSTTGAGTGCILWADNGGTTQKWVVEYVAVVAE